MHEYFVGYRLRREFLHGRCELVGQLQMHAGRLLLNATAPRRVWLLQSKHGAHGSKSGIGHTGTRSGIGIASLHTDAVSLWVRHVAPREG